MIDETLAQFRARRQNINRYRSLLQTSLTDFERDFIERRIAEEEAAVSTLAFEASPPDIRPREAHDRTASSFQTSPISEAAPVRAREKLAGRSEFDQSRP